MRPSCPSPPPATAQPHCPASLPPLLSSQAREAAPRPRGGDQHSLQRPSPRHHLQPGPAHLRHRGPVCPAAGGHHLCLPGDFPDPDGPRPAAGEGRAQEGSPGPHRPLPCSNTRSCCPAGSARDSSSETGLVWARAGRWLASSWRTTCVAGRRPCGEHLPRGREQVGSPDRPDPAAAPGSASPTTSSTTQSGTCGTSRLRALLCTR